MILKKCWQIRHGLIAAGLYIFCAAGTSLCQNSQAIGTLTTADSKSGAENLRDKLKGDFTAEQKLEAIAEFRNSVAAARTQSTPAVKSAQAIAISSLHLQQALQKMPAQTRNIYMENQSFAQQLTDFNNNSANLSGEQRISGLLNLVDGHRSRLKPLMTGEAQANQGDSQAVSDTPFSRAMEGATANLKTGVMDSNPENRRQALQIFRQSVRNNRQTLMQQTENAAGTQTATSQGGTLETGTPAASSSVSPSSNNVAPQKNNP